MVAAAACGGDVLVKNVIPKHLESISAKLIEAGAEIIDNSKLAIHLNIGTHTGKLTDILEAVIPNRL